MYDRTYRFVVERSFTAYAGVWAAVGTVGVRKMGFHARGSETETPLVSNAHYRRLHDVRARAPRKTPDPPVQLHEQQRLKAASAVGRDWCGWQRLCRHSLVVVGLQQDLEEIREHDGQ